MLLVFVCVHVIEEVWSSPESNEDSGTGVACFQSVVGILASVYEAARLSANLVR